MTRVDTPVAGVNITPSTAVFEVIDPQSLVFEANVDEVDSADIAIGKRATVTLDAFPKTPFIGSVASIAFAARSSSGGATVFPVEVSIATSSAVRIGMNGDVAIEADTQENVVVIPTESVREEEKASFVYKKEEKGYKKTMVELGVRSDSEVVVLSGLTEGDEVVVKGFTNLPK